MDYDSCVTSTLRENVKEDKTTVGTIKKMPAILSWLVSLYFPTINVLSNNYHTLCIDFCCTGTREFEVLLAVRLFEKQSISSAKTCRIEDNHNGLTQVIYSWK